jgi:general secretion pathway protein L
MVQPLLLMSMATDTVGLDIGRTAIKAVRLRQTLRGRESVDYLHQNIALADQTMGDLQRSQILKQFVQKHRLAGSRLVTAVPCSDLMIRTLALPFHDARKLTQVIPSEVESMIPLSLEDVAVDYELLTQKKEDKKTVGGSATQVLVAAAQRSTLRHHVQHLADAGIEPDAIRVDALALFSVVRHRNERQPEPFANIAMVDIGATKTTICLSYQGDPRVLRTVRCGTNQLTQGAVQRESSIDAESVAQNQLRVEPMEPGFSMLVRELRATLHAYEAITRHRLRYVWFCGGGAELGQLIATLGRCLELNPISLPELYRVPCAPAYSIAMGLALMGRSATLRSPWGAKSIVSTINLKRVISTTLAQSQEQRRNLWHIGLASLVVFVFAVGDLSMQVMFRHVRLQELKTELRAQFHAQFAGMEIVSDELDQAKAALQSVRKTRDFLGGEQIQMLPVLADLVRTLPKGIMAKITALTIEPGTIQIEARTDSFESMEKIRQGLLSIPNAREVMVRDARVGSTPNQVLFRMTVTRGI